MQQCGRERLSWPFSGIAGASYMCIPRFLRSYMPTREPTSHARCCRVAISPGDFSWSRSARACVIRLWRGGLNSGYRAASACLVASRWIADPRRSRRCARFQPWDGTERAALPPSGSF